MQEQVRVTVRGKSDGYLEFLFPVDGTNTAAIRAELPQFCVEL